jgi:DNA polymerase
MFGVYLRNLIAPKEGRVLIAVDLSQIEVRTLCWLSKDVDTMAEIAATDDIYEAFAIRFGLWAKDKGSMKANDSSLRGKVKAMVLGCGYGCGPDKFAKVSGMELRDAEKAVSLYREKMRKVTSYWKRLNEDIQLSINAEDEFTVDLPSNRSLRYGRIQTAMQFGKRQFVAMMSKYSKKVPVKIYGGLLSENASQALARDIFCDMLCKIDAAGHEIIFHVHDEVVIECDADKAEENLRNIISIMSTPPDWIPDIPLSAEGKILTKYEK